jgi:hypothetical protein
MDTVETGAAINPVPWMSVAAFCGSPTSRRSKQASLSCACLMTGPSDACGRLDSGPKRSSALEFLCFCPSTRDNGTYRAWCNYCPCFPARTRQAIGRWTIKHPIERSPWPTPADWTHFFQWCATHGFAPVPADGWQLYRFNDLKWNPLHGAIQGPLAGRNRMLRLSGLPGKKRTPTLDRSLGR